MDIGESIVGAYMRYIRECEVVVYNTFLRGQQGELDVVALKTGVPRRVWLCEVTTHIGGMLYPSVDGTDGTVKTVAMDMDLSFVINEDYTEKMRELAAHATAHSSATSEPAYRMLQILGHLRDGRFSV